jgi:hypothetical protein
MKKTQRISKLFRIKKPKKITQLGLSLIELMLGLSLSTLIITALLQHYLSTKNQYKQTQLLLEQAFELQLITNLIRDSTRSAGFTPCHSIGSLHTTDDHHSSNPIVPIQTSVGLLQSLHFNRMSEHFSRVKRIMSATELLVNSGQHYHSGQQIMIADCFHAEVKKILQAYIRRDGILLIFQKPLLFKYESLSYLGAWIEEEFFIKSNSQGNLSLFYKTNHSEELSTHVTNLVAHLKTSQDGTLLQVKLYLNDKKLWLIETKVRAL